MVASRVTIPDHPFGRSKAGQRFELPITKLDVRGANHTRLEAQGVAQVGMDVGRGVVPHDEVVAVGVLHLVDGDGPREREDAPVGDTADDTTISKYEGADSLCNPASKVSERATGSRRWYRASSALFHLGEVSGPDLVRRQLNTPQIWYWGGKYRGTNYCNEFVEHRGDGIYTSERKE